MSSITDDAMAFMKEIGLRGAASSSEPKKGKQKEKSQPKKGGKGGKSQGNNSSGGVKKNARKWGKENKVKKSEEAVEKTERATVTLSRPQMKEVAWLSEHTPSTSEPLVSLSEEKKWYDITSSFHTIDPTDHRTSKDNVKTIVAFAEQSFHADAALYHKLKNSSGFSQDQKWVEEVLKSGTLSDKIAALALQVQQSPPHELEALDSLIALSLKKEQRTSQLALEALKDLLIHNLLPDRRLKPIMTQALGYSDLNPQVVTLFWFEVELMKRTERIIEAIEAGLKSTVDFFKRFCMEVVYDWIVAKPEQEGRLLSLLVNKLGDLSSKICSKCVELLGKLVCRHTAMKSVVVREVRQLIYRANLPPRAVYSGIIFLSQIALSNKEEKVSSQLVECYVSLFEKAVTQDKLGSKLLVALLIGINRAYPYLRDKEAVIQHIDALFRIVHSASFSTSTQALTLISHIVIGHSDKSSVEKRDGDDLSGDTASKAELDLINRYYRALYSQLLADQLQTRSHNTLFLNLLFRSMKRDPLEGRVIAFVKRILICATQSAAPIAAGLIFLVSEVFQAKPSLRVAMMEVEKMNSQSESPENNYWLLGNFDASKRDASYACPLMPSIWEITLFNSHFHPSVQAFSSSFLDPEKSHSIKYDGDPTTDFSLSSFLNRFAYKNPKKGQFEMRRKRSQASLEEPVNSKVFRDMEISEIAPEKEFFHKFFYDRTRLREEGLSRDRSRHKSKNNEDSDVDLSDYEEDEMDKYADKLALDLMASAGNGPVDIDDDDFMDDERNDGDNGDGNELDMADDDSVNMEGDSLNEFVDSDDSDDSEMGGLDDSEDEDYSAHGNKKRKKGESDFASAEDFEDDMEAIISAHSHTHKEDYSEDSKKPSKKLKKKKAKTKK